MAYMSFSLTPQGTLIQMEGKHDQLVNKENFGPTDHYFAGIGAWMYAGIASYGRKFELPVEAITMTLDTTKSEETRLINKMDFQVKFPVDFPPQHKQSILKNMNACYVKKHLYDPPEVTVTVVE